MQLQSVTCRRTLLMHTINKLYNKLYNNQSIISAANEIKVPEMKIAYVTLFRVMEYGRRGYNSLNGIVTVISVDTGKCVDYRNRTKNCKTC